MSLKMRDLGIRQGQTELFHAVKRQQPKTTAHARFLRKLRWYIQCRSRWMAGYTLPKFGMLYKFIQWIAGVQKRGRSTAEGTIPCERRIALKIYALHRRPDITARG